MGFAGRLLGFARRAWAWLRRCLSTLLPCRFAILVLGLVAVILALTDQGLESLRVLAEFGNADQVGAREPYLLRLLIFFLGTAALASSAWYFSRQALLLDPPPRPVTREVEVLFRWAPRVLGMLGFVCPALALWFAAGQYGIHEGLDQNPSPRTLLKILAAAFFILGLGFGILLSMRRSRFALESLNVPEGRRRVRQLPASTQVVLWTSAGVTLGLFVGIIVAPIRLTAFVATPSVVLFCAAIWVFVGTVLVVSSARLRLPLFAALLLLLIVSSGSNDNHRVLPAAPARARLGLAEATTSWVSWMDEHYPEEPRHPIFVVAAEGGGLRAGYWTAAVLSAIQAQFPTFSDHCFAISGVSGGSLGAAVFDGLLVARPPGFPDRGARNSEPRFSGADRREAFRHGPAAAVPALADSSRPGSRDGARLGESLEWCRARNVRAAVSRGGARAWALALLERHGSGDREKSDLQPDLDRTAADSCRSCGDLVQERAGRDRAARRRPARQRGGAHERPLHLRESCRNDPIG